VRSQVIKNQDDIPLLRRDNFCSWT